MHFFCIRNLSQIATNTAKSAPLRKLMQRSQKGACTKMQKMFGWVIDNQTYVLIIRPHP